MAIQIDLQLASQTHHIPVFDKIQTWLNIAEICLTNPLKPEEQHCTIRIVDKTESKKLNQRFRKKEGPTNVLSFRQEPIPGFPNDSLGDIVICASLVEEEAHQQNKSVNAHWAHLVIHGFLHLLGYDHIQKQDAIRMEELEISILEKIGYENPYD